mgnify:CR=1 FL=1
MNEELYEALEQELEKNHVEEDVEDVLLDLAENIAERGIMDKEVIYGRTEVHGCGVCAEEDGETSVLIKWIRVGKKEFKIDDYFL